MIISTYTESIEKLITQHQISLFHRNWTMRKDGTYDYEKSHWCAKKYDNKGNTLVVSEGIGDTPRDAIVQLFKRFE